MEIKKVIKDFFVKLAPSFIKWEIEKPFKKAFADQEEINYYLNKSFSQEGEDLVLQRLLENKNEGFYVDIGAHHPFRFSNTYKFYLQGWKGINIDPLPGSMILFDKHRPRDINLEIGILNDINQKMVYYMFDEPALNTFSLENFTTIKKEGRYHLKEKKTLAVHKLGEVLKKYINKQNTIDFLTIDVEGMDLEVLKSNDWDLYKPTYILVESLYSTLINDFKSPLSVFLKEKNYSIVAKTVNTIIYKFNFGNENA